MVITSAFQADDEGSIPFFRLEAKYMDQNKKEKLIAAGWNVGTVQEFLDLTDEEVQKIEAALDIRRRINGSVNELEKLIDDLSQKLPPAIAMDLCQLLEEKILGLHPQINMPRELDKDAK